MAVYTYLTNVGASRIISAYGDSAQINVTSAQLSAVSLYNSNTTTMMNSIQAMTSLPNVEYTSPQNTILYNVYNANSLMLKVFLGADVGTFQFSSFAILADDGVTPLVIGTYDSAQTKTATNNSTGVQGDVRYLEVIIPFANIGDVINFSSLTQDNGSLPELTADSSLPAANAAPFPVYFLHEYSGSNNRPALAGRWADNWYYFPDALWIQDQSGNYAVDTSTTANTIIVALSPSPNIIAGLVIRVKVANTNTGNTVIQVNGGSSVPVINSNNNQLVPNQTISNSVYELLYDGTSYRLLSISGSIGIPPVVTINASSYNLTVAQSGAYIYITGNYATTLNLPAFTNNAGCNYTIFNNSIIAATLSLSTGSFLGPYGSGTGTFTLASGSSMTVWTNGSYWIVSDFTFNPVTPVVSIGSTGVMAANSSYYVYASFTAPVAGTVYAFGGHNLNTAATPSSSGLPGIQGTLVINTTSVASDNTLLSQGHMGLLTVTPNTAVTIQYTMTTSTVAPNADASLRAGAFFIAS